MLAATVTNRSGVLPARVRDGDPLMVDCPVCEDWVDIVIPSEANLDMEDHFWASLASLARYPLVCQRCRSRVVYEIEVV
jgi:hypothetical protein